MVTFIRLALRYRPSVDLPTPATTFAPLVELAASDPTLNGSRTGRVDLTANSVQTGVQLYDQTNQISAAVAFFCPPAHDVHLLKVVMEIPNTQLWLRITDFKLKPCDYVWVVADSDEEAKQPWLNVKPPYVAGAPGSVEIDAYIGQAAALNEETLDIENYGHGPLTIASCDPPLPAPYLLRGLPQTLAANAASAGTVTIGLDKPSAWERGRGWRASESTHETASRWRARK